MFSDARYVWWKHGKPNHWVSGYSPKEWEKVLYTDNRGGTIYSENFDNTIGGESASDSTEALDSRFKKGHTYLVANVGTISKTEPSNDARKFEPFKAIFNKQGHIHDGLGVMVTRYGACNGDEPGYYHKYDGRETGPFFTRRYTLVDIKPIRMRRTVVRVGLEIKDMPC